MVAEYNFRNCLIVIDYPSQDTYCHTLAEQLAQSNARGANFSTSISYLLFP